MRKKNPTPANKLIANLKSRKRAVCYSWICYSYKNKADIVLQSNQELSHWLLYLEFNKFVKSFVMPEEASSLVDADSGVKIKPDFIVENFDGSREWQTIRSGLIDQCDESYLSIKNRIEKDFCVKYTIFDDSYRHVHAYKVMPLLRLLNAICVNRFSKFQSYHASEIIKTITDLRSGVLADIANANPHIDRGYIFSEIARHYAGGMVELDIDSACPSERTEWRLYES